MVPNNAWYNVADAESTTKAAMLTMPLYDADGVEIPEEDLPRNNMPDENIVDDDFRDWSADDEPEAFLPPSAERRKRLAQAVREEALRRLELSARTLPEFQALVDCYDREEESRMRRERRYETLRGDVPLESGALPGGHILPHSLSQPTFRQISRGEFDDYLNTCLFAMHDLTDRAHLREIVMNLKLDHKEILFFLGVRLGRDRSGTPRYAHVRGTQDSFRQDITGSDKSYPFRYEGNGSQLFVFEAPIYSTQKLADLRGQTERNIRKVRDTVRRCVHRKLYAALTELQQTGNELIHLEQNFLRDYISPKRRHSANGEPV